MFAPRDQKAIFRVGSKVKLDWFGPTLFKVMRKDWDADGSLRYTVQRVGDISECYFVPQKELSKA
jgi:hypothetical protein